MSRVTAAGHVFVELLGCPRSGAESKGSDSHVSGLMGIMKSIDKEREMSETPQQYTGRLLGYLDRQDPVVILKATPATLDRVISSVPPTVLKQRPAPGKWSISEILAHLADTELVLGFRVRFILGAPGSPIAAFDQDRWAIAGHYDKRDPRLSVATIRALREANLALLESLDPEQWKHDGIHSERGQESIEHIVRMWAGHDLNHLQQIERIIGGAMK